jgi:N-methylhydantoinase A
VQIGVDIGGTFTDIVIIDDDGAIHTRKIPSLLDRVGGDIKDAVRAFGGTVSVTSRPRVVHGTTMASNAIIEGTTARTALLTTKGFRDVLEMRGQRGSPTFDLEWAPPAALVPRGLRFEVAERILSSGQVEKPLDVSSLERIKSLLEEQEVEALAICYVNSPSNPVHELATVDFFRDTVGLGAVCASVQVEPTLGEYERSSTTVMNAALMPLIRSYLDRLMEQLEEYGAGLTVMKSNGGIMTAELAAEKPVTIIESGPAAGVIAAARIAATNRCGQAISFDMGGTTAKACLISDGRPLEKTESEIQTSSGGGESVLSAEAHGAGHILRVPSLDIVEVGAGGGSIAWVDRGGILRVGPRSAGADPGPACYRRGGVHPTVTDANVVLGYISPVSIANNEFEIDAEASWRAIEREIAGPLGLSVQDAALGICRVADATMLRAVRAVSTERGHDVRDFVLVAFGGAGPAHAARLAENLEMKRVLVPYDAGVLSATGLLVAGFRSDHVVAVGSSLDQMAARDLLDIWEGLATEARTALAKQGAAESSVELELSADLRYRFQNSELSISLGTDQTDADIVLFLRNTFIDAHKRAYNFIPDDRIEVVNLRVKATAPPPAEQDLASSKPRRDGQSSQGQPVMRDAYFGESFGVCACAAVVPEDIVGQVPGPIIVDCGSSTVVVPPRWSVSVSEEDNSLILDAIPSHSVEGGE